MTSSPDHESAGNRFDGRLPRTDLLLQAGAVTGGIHYHYSTPEPVAPQQVPSPSRRSQPPAGHVAQLDALAEGERLIIVVTGPPATGKAVLALHWAQHHHDRWPDGQLWADLGNHPDHGPTPPGDVLTRWLASLGVPDDQGPDDVGAQAAELRTRTADLRILAVLDDAVSAAQVRPLLLASPAALTLITSRYRLAGLYLDGAQHLTLGRSNRDEDDKPKHA